ncbi:hypothetical protein F2Q69_00037239 [Brassica cretica]|uniref:Uncharacterized protein n=1 Tax=Brassica cretica TaxID=69181 RepID=A0A8S9SEZ9_BRACR|nr:hypothetical protein F2Q69_00037239 [Brassica cretica]
MHGLMSYRRFRRARLLRSDRAEWAFGRYVATELWLELGRYVATELWLELGRYVATERSKRLVAARTVGPLRPLGSEESHFGTTEPRPSRPQSSPRLNPCSGCIRESPERRRSSPSELETQNEERPWPLESHGSLILHRPRSDAEDDTPPKIWPSWLSSP